MVRGDSRAGRRVKMLVLRSNNCDPRVLSRLSVCVKVISDDIGAWDVMKTVNQCEND